MVSIATNIKETKLAIWSTGRQAVRLAFEDKYEEAWKCWFWLKYTVQPEAADLTKQAKKAKVKASKHVIHLDLQLQTLVKNLKVYIEKSEAGDTGADLIEARQYLENEYKLKLDAESKDRHKNRMLSV